MCVNYVVSVAALLYNHYMSYVTFAFRNSHMRAYMRTVVAYYHMYMIAHVFMIVLRYYMLLCANIYIYT